MSLATEGGRRGGILQTVLVLLVLGGSALWAEEVEFGLQGVAGPGAVTGVSAIFSGAASRDVWLFGGYGSGLWSPSFRQAGGGALVGLRPLPGVAFVAKAGLGAGFFAGEVGATRQAGAEVCWGGPGLVVAVSWERFWNLAQLPSLPSIGWDMWSLGVRFRVGALLAEPEDRAFWAF